MLTRRLIPAPLLAGALMLAAPAVAAAPTGGLVVPADLPRLQPTGGLSASTQLVPEAGRIPAPVVIAGDRPAGPLTGGTVAPLRTLRTVATVVRAHAAEAPQTSSPPRFEPAAALHVRALVPLVALTPAR